MMFSRRLLATAFVILTGAWAEAMPLVAPEKLAATADTEGLFVFDESGVKAGEIPNQAGEIPNLAGKTPAAKLRGTWIYERCVELEPAYAGAAEGVEGKEPAQLVAKGFAPWRGRAFRVDVVMRWNWEGGNVLRVGAGDKGALIFGILQRGPGIMELQLPVRTASGETTNRAVISTKIYEAVEPNRTDEFYTYSVTFDGKKTVRVLIDGKVAHETVLAEGEELVVERDEVAVGDVAKSKSVFSGWIAAVRVSRGETAEEAGPRKELARGKGRRAFDAGDSQVAEGWTALRTEDLYTKERGYGWLQTPLRAFDAWYTPGSFDSNADKALAKNEHHILNALDRDGVVLGDGDFFRLDVPDGRYWVRVVCGDNRNGLAIDALSANGTVLGKDLIILKERSVRGLVDVKNGEGLVLKATTGNREREMPIRDDKTGVPVSQVKWPGADHEAPIRAIEVAPYVPFPIANREGRLVWQGAGAEPAGMKELSAVNAWQDRAAALKLAQALPNDWLQACAIAAILGQPKLPEEADLKLADELRGRLIALARQRPDDAQVGELLESLDRFRHILRATLNEWTGSELLYGTRYDAPQRAVNYGLEFKPEDPLYWQARFLAANAGWQRSRTFFGFVDGKPEVFIRMNTFAGYYPPGDLLREVKAAYPDFRIARIMLGEKLRVEDKFEAPANAPEWAVLEHELQRRIVDVVHYWIENRMTPEGLLTGGIGDDVEVLGWWSPAVFLSDDGKVKDAWRRMAEAVWKDTGGTGFSQSMDDVQHSSETTSDALPMMVLLAQDSPALTTALERNEKTFAPFENIWSGVNADGYRMVKGSTMGGREIREGGGDVCYNLRLLVPELWNVLLAQGDAKGRELIVAYARSWRDATMSEYDGKPAGIVPMLISWDRRQAKLVPKGIDWVDPGYWSSLFAYPGGYAEKVYDLLTAAYVISGDKSFLDPIRSAMEAYRKVATTDEDGERYKRGTYEWALRKGSRIIGMGGANYRLFTGDRSFDDVLKRIGPPLTQTQIRLAEGDEKALDPLLARVRLDLDRMSANEETRTVMTKQTDMIPVSGSAILNAMATGMTTKEGHPTFDMLGDEFVLPSFQITWQGTEGEVAALVAASSPERLEVWLYNFGKAKTLRPRLWGLAPGKYLLRLAGAEKEIELTRKGQEVTVELPSQVSEKLMIERK